MPLLDLKASHKCVATYYANLAKFEKLGIKYESAVRTAFHELLEYCARQFDWKLVVEYPYKRKGQTWRTHTRSGGVISNNGDVRASLISRGEK